MDRCRICLRKFGDYLGTQLNKDLTDIIFTLSSVQISCDDGYFTHICTKCHYNVWQAYELRELCKKSDGLLKSGKIEATFEDGNATSRGANQEKQSIQQRDTRSFTIKFYTKGTGDKQRYICSICKERFQSTAAASEHMNKHKTLCKHCDKPFPTKVTLWHHIKKYHVTKVEKSYLCEFCGEGLENLQYFHEHTCVRKSQLQNDSLTRDASTSHSAVGVDEDFNFQNENISEQKKIYKCNTCNHEFDDLESVVNHLNDHLKTHQCDECGQRFQTKALKWMHLKTKHIDENLKPYLCTTCGLKFKQERHLEDHELVVHVGLKTFSCELCNKKFFKKGMLKIHFARMHLQKKTFTCEHCGKKFHKENVHNSHVARIHVNKGKKLGRKFFCNMCHEPFKDRDELIAHKLTHKKKLHSCKICKKLFFSPQKLAAHEKIHFKATSHKCPYCPSAFHKKHAFNVHVEMHEENENKKLNI